MADGVAGAHGRLRRLGDDGGGIGSAGGSRGVDGVSSRGAGGSGRCRAGMDRAGRVATTVGSGSGAGGSDARALGALGNAELGGVLVLAGDVVDKLEAVVGDVGLEAGGRSPGVLAAVGDTGHNGGDGDNVGGRSTEENKRDAVRCGWLPGDLEWLASRDDLEKRTGDRVALGLANWGVLGSGKAGEEGNDGSLGEHVDGGGGYYGINA